MIIGNSDLNFPNIIHKCARSSNCYLGLLEENSPILSLFPSFSNRDMLCDPIDFIWK